MTEAESPYLELQRVQGMVDLSADLLKEAKTPRGRESLVQQLTYYLKLKRELTSSQRSAQEPPSP
jgi:hypothetical protein